MTTIVFVHGTGVRQIGYVETWKEIEDALSPWKSNIPEIKISPCFWGGEHGTDLKAGGASIPDYKNTEGGLLLKNQEQYKVDIWERLFQDPLYEIRLLSLKPEGFVLYEESEKFSKRVEGFTPPLAVRSQLEKAKITEEVFRQAHQEIITSESYKLLLKKISGSLEEYYAAIAKAVVAEALILCEQRKSRNPIRFNAKWREEIVDTIISELTQNEQEQGAFSKFGQDLYFKSLIYFGNKRIDKERGALTDHVYPFTGDILYYQAKGKKIRDYIRSHVEKVEPPIILLAHSLGGIACVDLLVEQRLPQVKVLITVGSQAPFLYEIDALQSLSYDEDLPDYFPEWLNLYDRRDVLSYIGSELFPGKVTDKHIDNKLPFPESHGAYWQTEETWNVIFDFLKSRKLIS